ncbi:MAG: hypothetical protein AVDCRST_MAG73-337, partial [uncultured Thermomicrobiales bacterium]
GPSPPHCPRVLARQPAADELRGLRAPHSGREAGGVGRRRGHRIEHHDAASAPRRPALRILRVFCAGVRPRGGLPAAVLDARPTQRVGPRTGRRRGAEPPPRPDQADRNGRAGRPGGGATLRRDGAHRPGRQTGRVRGGGRPRVPDRRGAGRADRALVLPPGAGRGLRRGGAGRRRSLPLHGLVRVVARSGLVRPGSAAGRRGPDVRRRPGCLSCVAGREAGQAPARGGRTL